MVICMEKWDLKYQWILEEYPETITKEQLYKICHVSKKTASHYLENGLIPCVCSGMKTRKYRIRTVDVIAFLQAREKDAEAFSAPSGWYAGQYHGFPRTFTPTMIHKTTQALTAILNNYPDVLTSREVSEVTGYSHSAVLKWCTGDKLRYFNIKGGIRIPKISLVEYLTRNKCRALNEHAYRHILQQAEMLIEAEEPSLPE